MKTISSSSSFVFKICLWAEFFCSGFASKNTSILCFLIIWPKLYARTMRTYVGAPTQGGGAGLDQPHTLSLFHRGRGFFRTRGGCLDPTSHALGRGGGSGEGGGALGQFLVFSIFNRSAIVFVPGGCRLRCWQWARRNLHPPELYGRNWWGGWLRWAGPFNATHPRMLPSVSWAPRKFFEQKIDLPKIWK